VLTGSMLIGIDAIFFDVDVLSGIFFDVDVLSARTFTGIDDIFFNVETTSVNLLVDDTTVNLRL